MGISEMMAKICLQSGGALIAEYTYICYINYNINIYYINLRLAFFTLKMTPGFFTCTHMNFRLNTIKVNNKEHDMRVIPAPCAPLCFLCACPSV